MFLKFKTYNEGQYGLKPWMANLLMGIFEIILVIAWFICSFLVLFSSVLSLDIELVENADAGVGFALAAIYLLWNILVWCIKPLRTKFNCIGSLWNLLFIVWLIFDSFRILCA